MDYPVRVLIDIIICSQYQSTSEMDLLSMVKPFNAEIHRYARQVVSNFRRSSAVPHASHVGQSRSRPRSDAKLSYVSDVIFDC